MIREKVPVIGADLEGKIKKGLICFLRKNIDVFTWSHEDMPGIDPSVITHRLNVHPSFKPVRQKGYLLRRETMLLKKKYRS